MEVQPVIENFEMKLNESAKDFLKEIAKWAYLLSIVGYIGIGFIVLVAFFAGTLFSAMGRMNSMFGDMGFMFGFFISFIYLVIAALYFFPVYYLNKFATNVKVALRDNDSEALTTSLGYLKSHYKFIGIMMVIVFSIYFFLFFGMFVTQLLF